MYRYISGAGLVAVVVTVLVGKPPSRYVALLPLDALADTSDAAIARQGSVHTIVGGSRAMAGTMEVFGGTFRDGPFERSEAGFPKNGASPDLHKVGDQWVLVYSRDGEIALAVAAELAGPFTELGTLGKGSEPTIYRSTIFYVDNGLRARPFTLDKTTFAWAGEARQISKSGHGPGVVSALDKDWIIYNDPKLMIGELVDDRIEKPVPLLTDKSTALGGQWSRPTAAAFLEEADGIYAMYFTATNRDTSKRATLRLTLAFVDAKGQPSKPYIAEEKLALHAKR